MKSISIRLSSQALVLLMLTSISSVSGQETSSLTNAGGETTTVEQEDYILVELDWKEAPSMDWTEVSVSITPQLASISGAILEVLSNGGGESNPTTVQLGGIEQDETRTQVISIRATQLGTALFQFIVNGTAGGGELEGYRQMYVQLADDGTSSAFLDALPETPYAFQAQPIDAPTIQATFASPEGGKTPDVPAGPMGPLRPVAPGQEPKNSSPEAEAAGAEGEFGPLSLTQFQVKVCWMFHDQNDVGQLQRWATIEVWDDDTATSDDFLTSGITQTDGCFTSELINRAEESGQGNQDIFLKFLACNGANCVKDAAGNIHNGLTNVRTVGSEDLLDFGYYITDVNNAWAWRPFQYANTAWDYAANYAGYDGTTLYSLTITIPRAANTCGTPPVGQPDTAACYDRASKTMRLLNNGIHDRSPDIVGHEYGHHVQSIAYGSSYWPSPGGAHTCNGDGQSLGLAWTEGFATFFGVRTDQLLVGIPGATGDSNYRTLNLEGNSSCDGATGDDNEWKVAKTLWDLKDAVVDGIDDSSDTDTLIHSVIRNCDDAHLNDYYNGAPTGANSPSCNWNNQGGNSCNFVTSAGQNTITSFNQFATATVSSQSSFSWLRGTITISGTGSDVECPITNSEFRVSPDSTCSTGDYFAGTDSSSPFSSTFNTATMPDDSSVWTCMRAFDKVEWSPFDASGSSIGIDNTAPFTSATTSCSFPGYSGWCRSSGSITLSASDAMSGVSSTFCLIDGSSSACGTTSVSSQGSHSGYIQATDVAGNTGSSSTSFKIDSVAPTGGITSLPNPALLSFSVGWSASDYTSGVSRIEVQEQAATLGGGFTTVCGPSYYGGATFASGSCDRGTLALAPILPGNYCYRIVMEDIAGNVNTSAATCTLYV